MLLCTVFVLCDHGHCDICRVPVVPCIDKEQCNFSVAGSCGSVYFVLVLKLKGLTREELYEFPFGRKMSIVADKLHLLEEEFEA